MVPEREMKAENERLKSAANHNFGEMVDLGSKFGEMEQRAEQAEAENAELHAENERLRLDLKTAVKHYEQAEAELAAEKNLGRHRLDQINDHKKEIERGIIAAKNWHNEAYKYKRELDAATVRRIQD